MPIYRRSIVYSIISPTTTRTNTTTTKPCSMCTFSVPQENQRGGACCCQTGHGRYQVWEHRAQNSNTTQHNNNNNKDNSQIDNLNENKGNRDEDNNKQQNVKWDKGYDWVRGRINMQEQWEILIILVIVFFIWIILMFIMMQRSTRGRRRSLCKCIGATQSSDLGNIQSIQAVAI